MTTLDEQSALEICCTVAPQDVPGMGLRILQHRETWPVPPEGALALALHGQYLAIRESLIEAGEWPGFFGAYIVHFGELTLGIVLHELTHQLPAREPIPDIAAPPTAEEREAQSLRLAAWAADGKPALAPWRGHGAKWIRRAIHVHYRAEQAGLDVPLASMNVAGDAYALSPSEGYRVELGAEPQYMARKSFAEIDAEPMPPRFVKLFQRDVAAFYGALCSGAIEKGLE